MMYRVTQKRNPACTKVVDEIEVRDYRENAALRGAYHIVQLTQPDPPEATEGEAKQPPKKQVRKGRPKKSKPQ